MSNETRAEQPDQEPQSDHTASEASAKGANGGSSENAESNIEDLRAQVQEKENQYKYLYADFENYKKRVLKERSDLQKFGWEGVARELLPVADNLERALQAAKPDSDKALVDGIEMVLRQFQATLEKWGVKGIATEKKSFDPNFHDAVAQSPSDQHPEGQIVHEAERGYTLHGRLLRPSKVVVSSGAPQGEAGES